VEPFLDGVAASVIGLLLVTAFQFLRATVETGLDASVFFLGLGATYHFTDKFTVPVVIVVAAIAGQALFRSNFDQE